MGEYHEQSTGTTIITLIIGLTVIMVVSMVLSGIPVIGFIFTIICLLSMLGLFFIGLGILLYIVYWFIMSLFIMSR